MACIQFQHLHQYQSKDKKEKNYKKKISDLNLVNSFSVSWRLHIQFYTLNTNGM